MEMPPVGASAAVTTEVTLMFGWIWTIIVGAFIGWIASLIMKTDAQQGCLMNIGIGVVGALIANLVGSTVFPSAAAAGTASVMGIVWGVIGAVVLIAILKALKVLK